MLFAIAYRNGSPQTYYKLKQAILQKLFYEFIKNFHKKTAKAE